VQNAGRRIGTCYGPRSRQEAAADLVPVAGLGRNVMAARETEDSSRLPAMMTGQPDPSMGRLGMESM
jgi:hypothetical protein